MADYKYVGKSIRKKDAMQLLQGKPVFVDDITPRDALRENRRARWRRVSERWGSAS